MALLSHNRLPREKAERRLGELLKAKDPKPAYDFWL